jgi:hypothetical protein
MPSRREVAPAAFSICRTRSRERCSTSAISSKDVFRFFIVELDYVNPLDRPLEGWHFSFNFLSGF